MRDKNGLRAVFRFIGKRLEIAHSGRKFLRSDSLLYPRRILRRCQFLETSGIAEIQKPADQVEQKPDSAAKKRTHYVLQSRRRKTSSGPCSRSIRTDGKRALAKESTSTDLIDHIANWNSGKTRGDAKKQEALQRPKGNIRRFRTAPHIPNENAYRRQADN